MSAIQGGGHKGRSITNLNSFFELVCHFCEYGRVASLAKEAEYKLLRLLDISEIDAITPVSLKRHENTFGIVTRARTFYLQAKTQDEVEDWVAKLNIKP